MSEEKKAKTPLKAIRAYCIDCSGSNVKANRCDNEECKLFDFRTGHNPFKKKYIMTEEQKAKSRERIMKMLEARKNK